jgi:hypothetical protein
MSRSARSIGRIAGLILATLLFVALPASSVEKTALPKLKVVSTVVAENDRVKVLENRFRPGAVNENPPSSSMRVVRALKGGALLRTYADGKTETVQWKTGETKIQMPSAQAYTTKNVGKSDVVLYIVILK